MTAVADDQRTHGRALEVLGAFLRLGLTSFGGPVAHLGYFRSEFVERRRWLDDKAFADLIALCQFLPGPASSQAGFAIGLMRAGPLGAAAAWVGFTLPSAIVMTLLGLGASRLSGPVAAGTIHGLKLVAVAVVAQAVWGMARTLAPDRLRAGLALAGLVLVTLVSGGPGQLSALALGAVVGLFFCQASEAPAAAPIRLPRSAGAVCLALFALLLLGLPLAAPAASYLKLAAGFYHAGALVFGGGHVVLPLLQDQVVRPGWVRPETFLAGYAAAQAMPGPLFTIAAFLGSVNQLGVDPVAGAAIALAAIFLPGVLILLGALPFWSALRAHPRAQGALRGVNAAVVGVLAAALYSPVFTSAVLGPRDLVLAAAGFVALQAWRAPPILVVGVLAGVGAGLAGLHI